MANCFQFMLTVSHKGNPFIIYIDRQRAIWIKFPDHSWLISSVVEKKTGRSREVILARDALQWPLYRGLNMSECTDCPPEQKKKGAWPLQRGGRQWTFDCYNYLLKTESLDNTILEL